MKNDSHPLLQALKRRGPVESPTSFPEADRIFQIKKDDIPEGKSFDAGDNARFAIHGKIRSTHDDGSMMMHVYKVEHQDGSDISEAPKTQIVTTQESHRP